MDPGKTNRTRAVCQTGTGTFLYVANFSGGTIDVFDDHRKHVTSFTDPGLPYGYVPIELSFLDGNLFVTFAQRNTAHRNTSAEPDYGVIAEFSSDGVVLDRAEFRAGRRQGAVWHRRMPERVATGHSWRKRTRRAVKSRQTAW